MALQAGEWECRRERARTSRGSRGGLGGAPRVQRSPLCTQRVRASDWRPPSSFSGESGSLQRWQGPEAQQVTPRVSELVAGNMMALALGSWCSARLRHLKDNAHGISKNTRPVFENSASCNSRTKASGI